MNHLPLLRSIADVLVSDSIDYIALSKAIHAYKNLLLEVSEVDIEDEAGKANLHVASGKAIGLTWAALCVDDLARTRAFVKGVYEAVRLLWTRGVAPVQILYAGSGPFAALVLPVLAMYGPDDVQVTLIEVNPYSYESVKKVVPRLQLNGFIQAVHQADAATYQIREEDRVDIILSETMQRALKTEPQVSILANLVRQVEREVIVIPEKIVLELGLLPTSGGIENREVGKSYRRIAEVFVVSRQTIKAFHHAAHPRQLQFPATTLDLTGQISPGFHRLVIFTEIQVFNGTWLRTNESGLTIPWIMEDLSPPAAEGRSITLQYQVGPTPGIVYSFSPQKVA